jgi:RND superfamily putative drug exporter
MDAPLDAAYPRRAVTERLARAAARHPWRVIGAWIAALVLAIGVIATSLGDVLTSDARLTNDPESYRAYDLEAQRLPPDPNYVTEVIVVRARSAGADTAGVKAYAARVGGELQRTGDVTIIENPAAISPDGKAALITLHFNRDGAVPGTVDRLRALSRGAFSVEMTGDDTADEDFNKLSQEDLEHGELFFGLPASLLILLIVFGTLVAGVLPLLMAIVAIIVALALVAIVGQEWDLSVFVVNMLTGMGLALGIDYTLFVLSRFREERTAGRDKFDAIAASGMTASRAVVFSGLAFILAMTGLLLVPSTIFRSLAAGAILVGLVSVIGALTLLPAVLSLLGDRVNALRVPFLGRSTGSESRFWLRVVDRVLKRPATALALSAGLLILLALPAIGLKTGENGLSVLPDRFPAKQGFLAFERSFGVGTTDTLQVVVDGDVSSPPVAAAVRRLAGDLRRNPNLRRVSTNLHPDSNLAVIEALPVGDSRSNAAIATAKRLRAETVPRALAGTGARGLVTGETAESVDYRTVTETWLPRVIAFVLLLSFLLLTLAFRSIVVAAEAIVLNLLSVGAAYGVLVLVFVHGVGNELFGFEQVDFIEAWVPLFLFSVLFGLSMDYHVFLLSRIRERYSETGDNDGAIRFGIGSTARMITGAALIIIAVFAGFARGDLVQFQQMGFGVAVALFLDATVIRSVLVPASMKLLAHWNWYLPSWLQWLPNVHVEGPSERAGAPQPTA